MRQLKFRCWYVDKKKWKNGFYVGNYSVINGRGEEYDSKSIIITQFTGLVDRSGKEIYEGDIVQYYDNTPELIKFGIDQTGYADSWCGFNISAGSAKNTMILTNRFETPDWKEKYKE